MSDLDHFARRFDDLLAQIDSADVRVPEDSALIGLAADLVPTITRLLRTGIELLSDVEAAHAPPADEAAEVPESLRQIGLQISMEYAARDLDDIAFFARTDLRNAHEQLIGIATRKGHMMALATHCESSLRRLHKALISVESALFEFEGRPAPQRRWFDLEVSLQIRKLYWNLRRETGGHTVDRSKPLDVRLRSVLYRIVAFRELSVYPLLRVEDRVSLRRLSKGILEWLNGDERRPAVARRLWQDLTAFADILVHVSHRQELQEHDLSMVSNAYRTLFGDGRTAATVPAALVAEAQALLGLDDELDGLILQGSRGQVEAWRQPLQRLQRSLSQGGRVSGRLDLLSD
jgi:hypothetical protein